ncbi:hypothetical protein EXIGLDRAFT_377911 [Exidia glandulosa HHB12029]|uniref:AAA+ ATPase domain-containing protein n=1 Tax=Exidia glandulosa HHB12029 TaxID=1314781 RepID=A0A165Q106_EXIGL|nr:hypothetical protein EXIGLDRAFT_377911 [Exidia glandulosa HHB12029]
MLCITHWSAWCQGQIPGRVHIETERRPSFLLPYLKLSHSFDMALALGLSTAAHALDTAGQGVAQSILNTASSVTTIADGIRVNREAARRLAHRVDELVTVMAAEMQSRSLEDASEEWKDGVAVFIRSLDEAKDALLALSRRSHLAQLLHQKRDTEAIDRASENVQRAFDKLKIRAYLDIRARSAAVVQPLEQAKALRVLEAQAKELELLASESSRAAAGSASRLPNAPPLFFGRDEEIIAIVRAITSPTGGNVAILGGPGMGKTSTAVTVLHHPVVAARFPARRYFVACDAIDGESGLLAAICTAVGVPAKEHNAAGAALATALGSSRSLVALDNFETVWEASHLRTAAEDVLHLLSGIENLSLLITARGSERPQGVLWTKPALPPLGPLTTASAKQIFASIANVDDTDPHFLGLLDQLDNVPLAVTLLAHQAQFQPLDVLAARWNEVKTALLARTVGASCDRLSSLDVSIALSLESPRMKSAAHGTSILSLIAVLPLGAKRTDITLWTSRIQHSERALSTILQCALAYTTRDDRIAVLSPIREYMLAYHPPPEDAIRPLYAHYFNLVDFEDRSLHPSPDIVVALLPELDNWSMLYATPSGIAPSCLPPWKRLHG